MGNSVKSRQIGLIINYISIVLILVIFYLSKNGNIPKIYLFLEIIPITIAIYSFIKVFGKTGIWNITHHNEKKLDERELKVVYKATSNAYGIFTIVTLIIIYAYALIKIGPIDVMLAAALLYFAHTLPAAIITCREKQV